MLKPLTVCMHGAQLFQSCPTLCNPMDCSPPAPLFMGFSRQEYWSGLPFPPQGNLPDPGIKSMFPETPVLEVVSLPAELSGKSFDHVDHNKL
jgi:hypothetical protein